MSQRDPSPSGVGGDAIARRLAVAVDVVRAAGALALDHFAAPDEMRVEYKGPQDPVTVADRAVEAMLVGGLASAFSDDGFLGEEEGWRGSGQSVWVIDPIDGTANFARRLPCWCISVGLLVDGVIEAGIIYQPVGDELFIARRGAGATCNGRTIRVSSVMAPGEARVATGYSARMPRADHLEGIARLFAAQCEYARIGSAALGLAYVADGRYEAYWEGHLNAWDAVAGVLLVSEAGGLTSDFLAGGGLYRGNALLACAPGVAGFLNGALGSISGCEAC